MSNYVLKRITGSFFNTEISVAADCEPEILSEILVLCEKYETLLSKTVPGSDVWRINHSCGRRVSVSFHTVNVLKLALQMFRESGGCFNIAIGSAVRLWRFNEADTEHRIPEPQELSGALRLADCGQIQLDETGVAVPDGMEIDLGGIAKGYIADELGNFLRKRGVKSALINLGGNILTIGGKPDGSDWSIGLQLPVLDHRRRKEFWGVLRSRDNSVVTSGSYERGFLLNGMWYHHILDPHSGMPARNGVLSVTVCAPTSFLADALSTPLFLLGPEEGRKLAEKYGVFAAYYMEDNRILCCPGTGLPIEGTIEYLKETETYT